MKKYNKHNLTKSESLYMANQWELMGRKFIKNKLALIGIIILGIFFLNVIFCEFFAPFDPYERSTDKIYHPAQLIRIIEKNGKLSLPFIYNTTMEINMEELSRTYVIDESDKQYLGFFVKGDPYKLWGIFPAERHFFGVRNSEGNEVKRFFLFGSDSLGRDMFSRVIYALRISLTIGLLGVFLSFVIGVVLGAISAFYGGIVDIVIQRIIELLMSIPTIPLWMALTAALPRNMPPLRIYFGITIILSILGWTGLARVVRGKLLEVKASDYVMYARITGAKQSQLIFRHMIPSFISYLIVHLTLAIPRMILGETSLSFLGLGLQPPVISLGVLLYDAQNFRTIISAPHLLIPSIFVVLSVLAFNFVGDGLRDAADPYSQLRM